MAEDQQNSNRNRPNRNRNRPQRPQRGRGGGGGGRNNRRPLLTPATNAAVLSLIGAVLVQEVDVMLVQPFGVAAIAFILSSGVSYFAQRAKANSIEKISDAFFFVGLITLIFVALSKLGIV